MKHRKISTVVLVILLAFSSSIYAQQEEENSKISVVHFLEGQWKLTNYESKDRKNWTSIGETKSNIVLEHGGKFVYERVKYLTGFGEINMITYIGFDYRIGKLKLCAMDKEYASMDVYYGEKVGGDFVFTNIESDKPILMQDGKKLFFKLTYADIDEKGFVHWVEGTYDKGKTWFPFSKSVYSKE